MMADPGRQGPGPGDHQREAEHLRRMQDLEHLKQIIMQWNANRLDLFELSMPNEDLEFTGVMRFYYQAQDLGSGQKVATKCIRVSSTATNKQIIETLIEKFRPDMKMLEVPEYALYEIHESGERRLGLDEKPLLVQLNWHRDDREGRFLLRRIDEHSNMPQPTQEDSSFKRKLSKREKKELKKQEKKEKVDGKTGKGGKGEDGDGMANKLYTELPDTSFTRSISNPEAVMRRRRQQKLEKKLQQYRSKDGAPDTGGMLKIYGEALRKEVPYKTLLLSVQDTAGGVVREMVEKYGLPKSEAPHYCLVQSNLSMPEDGAPGVVVGGGTTREYILDDDDCPLNILMNHQASKGAVTFHVRRRPSEGGAGPRRRKKKSAEREGGREGLPFLVELTPEGGENRVARLQLSVTEVGSEVGGGGVQLAGLLPRHCVLAHTEGVVTVTPCDPRAEVVVNGRRAVETTILQHGAMLRFGRSVWRFIDPGAVAAQGGRVQGGPSQGSLGRHGGSTATLPGDQSWGPGMRSSTANYAAYPPQTAPRGQDAILPAVLEFREDTEEVFFDALTINLDPSMANFKLAPTYTIYMATRFRASTHYRPELVPEERAVRLTDMLNRVADRVLRVLDQQPGATHAPTLGFWMANASELLHFLKSDRHITAFSLQAQDMLADAVHIAFKKVVQALQGELKLVLPSLLTEQDQEGEQSTAGIISVFSSAMGLLRKCRVNAALTIQLFSQLFHFVNMWTFNTIVQGNGVNFCTHKWGLRLKRRLAKVEVWAEKQGLELAADCHLARVTQAAHLLQARKATAEDIASLSSTCFKLNSLQLEALLSNYQAAEAETPISPELISTIVRVAQSTVDELTRGEGRQVTLEEDWVLQLPFLLPEDNYSCDIVRGVPGGLTEFLAPLQQAGLAVMTPQPTSSGYWTIYMETLPPLTPVPRSPSQASQMTMNGAEMQGGYDNQNGYGGPRNGGPMNGGPPHHGGPPPQALGPPHQHMGGPPVNGNGGLHPEEPEIQTIRLSKTNGMGLSIVAAKGVGKERLGIYIKAVVEGGAAWQDGSLEAGDQLLRVDGHSLVGITQEKAAEIMMRTGPVVTLDVAKQGAIYHGLAALLSQPSPVMAPRGPPAYGGPGGPEGPRGRRGAPPPGPRGAPQGIPQSRSTPALHQSPGDGGQHNYQNQEWLHHQLGPRPPAPHHHSAQHLGGPRGPHDMGPRGGPHDPQGFYQNLAAPGPPGPPPLHRQRFGSQTSLTGGPQGPAGLRDRPASAHFPPGPGPAPQRFQTPRTQVPPPQSSAGGPEKPQRQFSYELENQAPTPVRSQSRVRFQDPQAEEEEKVSTIKRNGNLGQSFEQAMKERQMQEEEERKREAEQRIEEKRRELEEAGRQEEKLLAEARRRSVTGQASPPPLPSSPPPRDSPPPTSSSNPTPGTARLDMLLGNGGSRKESPLKRVSFMPPVESREESPLKRVSF